MKYELSYLRVSVKAFVIDFTISILISIFLLITNFSDYFSNKCYILPIISALATVLLSISIVYKDRNRGVTDKLITSIVLVIICIFCLMAIIVSIDDVSQFPAVVVLKFPLSAIIAMFLPNNHIQVNEKEFNKEKLDPKKKITDDIYYY